MIFQKIKKRVMLQDIPTQHVSLILWLKVNIFVVFGFLIRGDKEEHNVFSLQHKANCTDFTLSDNTCVEIGENAALCGCH